MGTIVQLELNNFILSRYIYRPWQYSFIVQLTSKIFDA